MSISPLHGGLVWNDEPKKANTYEEEKSAGPKQQSLELNTRDINEFFNPRVSDLSLDERHRLVMSVGEEVI
jgi:hypothetical protein